MGRMEQTGEYRKFLKINADKIRRVLQKTAGEALGFKMRK